MGQDPGISGDQLLLSGEALAGHTFPYNSHFTVVLHADHLLDHVIHGRAGSNKTGASLTYGSNRK